MQDLILDMGTLARHNHLVSSFFPSILSLFKKKELYPLQETCELAYIGNAWCDDPKLIDVNETSLYDDDTINRLSVVQPDFLFFQKNKFVQNTSTSRTLGVPDLVIEVWSLNNSLRERNFKQCLYSSSKLCEHWYLTQDSNKVECWLGDEKLKAQYLTDILQTVNGICFDLQHMAI